MFDYNEYFKSITPRTKMQIYNRFIFSFCSIHTTWSSNVRGYEMMKNKYHANYQSTLATVKRAGLGMNRQRALSITRFTKKFHENENFVKKKTGEGWQNYAQRLQNEIYGLGFAKTRFAIELMYPVSARIVCVDTHIIQWAKQSPKAMTKTLYHKIEQGFMNHAKALGLMPVEARWKYWDNKQGYKDPRYWSYVLE